MSKEELAHYAGLLYDVVESSNAQAIPGEQAAETLKLLNPALEAAMAAGIAADHDSKGKQSLSRDDFVAAVQFALQTTDMGDSIQIVRDLTIRMRVAFRRRYLMYDAPASTPPPALLENPRSVSMYRDLWDFVAGGSETITRPQLRKLATAIMADYPNEATNITKAAIGDRETDAINFLEFVMVVQQATNTRSLSEMVNLARRKFDADHDMQVQAQRKIMQTVANAGFAPDKAAAISHQLKENARLQQEVYVLASSESVAAERARSVLYAGNSNSMSALNEKLPAVPPPMSPQRPAADAALERELAKLRTENEKLSHALALAGGKKGRDGEDAVDVNNQTLAAARAQRERESSMQNRIKELESELRQARAQLAISTEAQELAGLLRASSSNNGGQANKTQVLKEHFVEELTLVTKHRYIRDVAARFDDPNSPVSLLIGQYELLVSGYQALYRDLKQRWEYAKSKRFNPMEAAKSIVAHAQSTPMGSKPLQPASPLQVASSVYSWAELDTPPNDQLRHTGMPGDPLLTEGERQHLRAKLAAQMRATARHYTPSRGGYMGSQSQSQSQQQQPSLMAAGRSTPRRTPSQMAGFHHGGYSPEGNADVNADSMDAIRQLQAMTPTSYHNRRY